jgi:hypothetical protein
MTATQHVTTSAYTTSNNPWLTDGIYSVPFTGTGTLTLTNTIQMNKVQQNKVAVFKIARNEDNEITSAEFLTEMWVETKNGSSVDFEVARDTELGKYKASDLAIKTLQTLTF